MENRPPSNPDRQVLPEQRAAQLLKRASELDAARRTGSEIAELRAAAVEAGISTAAFDDALAEMHRQEAAPVQPVQAQPARRLHRWGWGVAAALLLMIWFAMRVIPNVVEAPAGAIVEESIPLRCMPADQAINLIRGVLGNSGTVSTPYSSSPRTLRIRATPDQLQRVRALLDEQDRTGSAACAVPTTTPNPPR